MRSPRAQRANRAIATSWRHPTTPRHLLFPALRASRRPRHLVDNFGAAAASFESSTLPRIAPAPGCRCWPSLRARRCWGSSATASCARRARPSNGPNSPRSAMRATLASALRAALRHPAVLTTIPAAQQAKFANGQPIVDNAVGWLQPRPEQPLDAGTGRPAARGPARRVERLGPAGRAQAVHGRWSRKRPRRRCRRWPPAPSTRCAMAPTNWQRPAPARCCRLASNRCRRAPSRKSRAPSSARRCCAQRRRCRVRRSSMPI